MKKHLFLISIAILVMMTLIGCPNDDNNNGNGKITDLQSLINKASAGDTINLNNYNISNYNATVNKALTINAADKNFGNANVTVTADGVVLNNVKNSNVTASASLGNGSLKIASSSLSTLTINGGGINSIELFDEINVDTLIVNKETSANQTSENVRIQISNQTSFTKTTIASNVLFDAPTGYNPNDPNTPPLFKEDISFGDNAFNIAFRSNIDMTKPDNMAKATFETDLADKSFYIFVKEGNRLNKAMVKQTANVICGGIGDIYKEGSSLINYDESLTGYVEYTTELRDTKPFVVYTKENLSILDAKNLESQASNLEMTSSKTEHDLFNQAMDMNGNIYFRTKYDDTSSGATLCDFTKVSQEISGTQVSYNAQQIEVDAVVYPDSVICSRIDIFDNGNCVLLAEVSVNKTDSETEMKIEYEPYLKVYEVICNEENRLFAKKFIDYNLLEREQYCDTIGDDLSNISIFPQAVAFDNNGDIYVAMCKYTYKQEAGESEESGSDCIPYQISEISNAGSYICKYTFNKNGEFLEKPKLVEDFKVNYDSLGIFMTIFDQTYDTESTMDYSDETQFFKVESFVQNIVAGIQDMKVVDGKLVICSSNHAIGPYYIQNKDFFNKTKYDQKVVFYDFNTGKITTTIEENNDKNPLYGPCRIAYADREVIAFYDEGYTNDNGNRGDVDIIKKELGNWELKGSWIQGPSFFNTWGD